MRMQCPCPSAFMRVGTEVMTFYDCLTKCFGCEMSPITEEQASRHGDGYFTAENLLAGMSPSTLEPEKQVASELRKVRDEIVEMLELLQ